jgi:hypothetical protein
MPRTVKVRIAVAVDPTGDWNSCGYKTSDKGDEDGVMQICVDTLGSGEARYWLTAELEVPEAKEVVATVEKE